MLVGVVVVVLVLVGWWWKGCEVSGVGVGLVGVVLGVVVGGGGCGVGCFGGGNWF